MSLLPNPDDPIPLSDATADAQVALANTISGIYANAMQAAEKAINTMADLAKFLEERNRHIPGLVQQAMDVAGLNEIDRRALCRFLELTNMPFHDKLASGCLHLGSMANARRKAKETP
jgi:hypothetical protein